MGSDTTSVYDTLGDTLVVEPVNLLQGDMVLEKSRAGALRVRSFQPDIGRKATTWENRGRGTYHVSVLSKGIPCIVVIPPEGWSF